MFQNVLLALLKLSKCIIIYFQHTSKRTILRQKFKKNNVKCSVFKSCYFLLIVQNTLSLIINTIFYSIIID